MDKQDKSLINLDMKQFSIAKIMIATVSFAVAAWIGSAFGIGGQLVFAAVSAFWVGFGFLVVSDVFGNGPIEDRSPLSQMLNGLGLIVMICAIFPGLGGVFLMFFRY